MQKIKYPPRALDPNIPPGLCQCGCGKPTPIAKITASKRGWFKGKPQRFYPGHNIFTMGNSADHFWSRVDRRAPDECWEWQGSRLPQGYGHLTFNGNPKRAHCVAYELAFGEIPDGQSVLHRCDNPPCCNPSHLFLGTQLDNMRDMQAKGRGNNQARGQQGETNRKAKLTDAQVHEIRQRHTQGERISDLAVEFTMTHGAISHIVKKRNWRHLL